jgi:hypothetical protein
MKTHLPVLLLLGTLLSISTTSIASVKMMGAGNVTCKEWTTLRASTEYFSAGNWVLGFLSSTAWSSGEDILAASKADGLFNAVDGYCSKHPKQSIADAAVELANHMLDKTSAK